ncbi:MAG: nitroreductase family protein, partial [Candidatus Marinimicrobia bacterium]|nr:nitroreductase family protein [Candidatus Neomarinimicrobiota bacterium]
MKKIILFILIGVIMMGFFSQHKVMAATEGKIISLPSPQREGGLPLMEALSQRISIRSYTDTKLPEQVLSNLLWAAWGYNRQELKKRTAPSSMNKQEISLYLAMEDGLYLYDAAQHALICVKSEDLRKKTGSQLFVGSA